MNNFPLETWDLGAKSQDEIGINCLDRGQEPGREGKEEIEGKTFTDPNRGGERGQTLVCGYLNFHPLEKY